MTPRNQIQELTNSDKNEDSQPAQAPQLPPLTQFSEETNESYVEVQNDDVNPKLTPKQDNTSLKNPDATKVSTRTIDSLTLPSNTNDDISGFGNVHYRLFDCVMLWMTEEDAKKSLFYTKWQKALYEGLRTVFCPFVRTHNSQRQVESQQLMCYGICPLTRVLYSF